VGMGKSLATNFAAARQVFDEVDAALASKLSTIIFEGPSDALTLTENAQPALMAVSLAALRVMETESGLNLAPDAPLIRGPVLRLGGWRRFHGYRCRTVIAHTRAGHAESGPGWRRCDGGVDRPRI